MLREDCYVGQQVIFGRPNGEKTLGIVKKVNNIRAQVETLTARGKNDVAGKSWGVPYSMMQPNNDRTSTVKQVSSTIDYNQFNEDNTILMLIGQAYSALSPENLSCDGEASASEILRKSAKYNRWLKGLQLALGYTVSEEQWAAWDDQRVKQLNEKFNEEETRHAKSN